jgi:hypothetical protein
MSVIVMARLANGITYVFSDGDAVPVSSSQVHVRRIYIPAHVVLLPQFLAQWCLWSREKSSLTYVPMLLTDMTTRRTLLGAPK